MMVNNQIKTLLSFVALAAFLLCGLAWIRPLQAEEAGICYWDKSALPSNAATWAGVANVGFPLDGKEMSARPLGLMTTQIEVVVNSPDRPVALYLSSKYPVIWNFRWTPETKIAAVLISGSEFESAVGLPEDAIVTYAEPWRSNCGNFWWFFENNFKTLWNLNQISKKTSGRPMERLFLADSWRLVLGERHFDPADLISADARLRQTSLKPLPEKSNPGLRSKKTPRTILPADNLWRIPQQTGLLQESLNKNHLRILRQSTLEAWLEKNIRFLGIENLADEETGFENESNVYRDGYEVSSPDFRLTDVCTDSNYYHIFYPENMDVSRDNIPDDLTIGKCSVYFGKNGDFIDFGRLTHRW